jgi:PAS domain S-box-containing protein
MSATTDQKLDQLSGTTNWRVHIQFIAFAAILVCIVLAALHINQRSAIIKELNSQVRFRQARLDLAHGFLHISTANATFAPFDRDKGNALLLQALRELRAANIAIGADQAELLEHSISNFQAILANWLTSNNQSESAVALRIAFQQLKAISARIDMESQSRIRAFAVRQEQVFLIGLASTLGLLGLAWLFVYQMGRSARQAEQRETQTTQLLRAIVDGTSDGIFVKDREGRILLANDPAAKFVGVSLDRMRQSRDADLLDAASIAAVRENDRQVLDFGSSLHVEETLTTNGVTSTYLVSKCPWRGAAGEILGVIGITRDITTRQRMEQALRESEERYRRLIEVMPDALLIIEAGKVVFCNASSLKLFDAESPEQLLGKTTMDLFDSDCHAMIQQSIEKMLATGESAPSSELAIVPLSGKRVPVSVVATPMYDCGIDSIMVAIRDMTHQKKIEYELRNQELLLTEAAELAHVGGWGFDPNTLASDITPETRRIYGMKDESELGVVQAIEMHEKEDRPRIQSAVEEAIKFGKSYDLELPITTFDGVRKWVRTICNPVVEKGTVVRVRGSIQDITDRKSAEAEIMQLNANLEARVQERTQELQAANRELEAFSYSVSHDLRAPLRAIDGFSRIVLEDFSDEVSSDAQELLRDIRRNTQQMGFLVDDLLEFSRLSRQPLNVQPVDVAELVTRCVADVHPGKNKTVEFHIGELPPCVGDPRLLKQVWLNLLSNAIKYSEKRNSPVIEVGCEVEGDRNVYYVKDNGVGFDSRYSHKLFGVFQRLHRAEDYEGNGVGLAVVQRIIQRHGGRIWAESQLDNGATFSFQLSTGSNAA